MNYFALITRGLEDIALQEMQEQIPGIQIISQGYKRVLFSYEGDPKLLLNLKATDDVFCHLDTVEVARQKISLDLIKKRLLEAHFNVIFQSLKKLRDVSDVSFSVTVSNVGPKNYTPKEIKELLVKSVSDAFSRQEKEDGTQTINIRVFIEKEECLLGIRVGSAPLHRRAYKTETLPGSLKPSIAYSMVRLATIKPGETVLDPMCGGGTIAFEATSFTDKVLAGDEDEQALAVAKQLAEQTEMRDHITFQQRDARALPLEPASVDHIVSNLPFGKQIHVANEESFFSGIILEMTRVLKPKGSAVLLTAHAELIVRIAAENGLRLISQREISLFGLNPQIIVLQK